jgi:hypothetical protein
VKFLREEKEACVFEVGSGTYRFALKQNLLVAG